MRRYSRTLLAVLAMCSVGAASAGAEEFRLSTDFGPVTLQVNEAQRTVFGVYPKFDGRIYAQLQDHGGITGVWVQPTGDHPCRTTQHGQANWGWMHFSRPHGGLVRGSWGYCDAPMDHDWNGVAE